MSQHIWPALDAKQIATCQKMRQDGKPWKEIARTLPFAPSIDWLRKAAHKAGVTVGKKGIQIPTNKARLDLILSLTAKGKSLREVADILHVSRGTVSGYIHRYRKREGLPLNQRALLPRPPPKLRARVERKAKPPAPPKTAKAPKLKAVALPLPETPLRDFLSRLGSECAFPMWSHYDAKPKPGEMPVCGRPRFGETSYCEAHAALCFAEYIRPVGNPRGLAA